MIEVIYLIFRNNLISYNQQYLKKYFVSKIEDRHQINQYVYWYVAQTQRKSVGLGQYFYENSEAVLALKYQSIIIICLYIVYSLSLKFQRKAKCVRRFIVKN